MVLERWMHFAPFLGKMMGIMAKQTYEEAKIITNEVRHQKFQLLEAKVSFDGVLFYQAYHKMLQTVLRSCFKVSFPDALLFTKQVGHMAKLLSDKYEGLCEVDVDGEVQGDEDEEKKGTGSAQSETEAHQETKEVDALPMAQETGEAQPEIRVANGDEAESTTVDDEPADDEGLEEEDEPTVANDDYAPRHPRY
jgi:hypothetical protein